MIDMKSLDERVDEDLRISSSRIAKLGALRLANAHLSEKIEELRAELVHVIRERDDALARLAEK